MPTPISVSVVGTTARLVNRADIICGNAGYVLFITFSAEWAECVTAHFSYIQRGRMQTETGAMENFQIPVPPVNETELLAVVFTDGENVSDPLFIPCKPSIRDFCGELLQPKVDQYDYLMEKLHDVEGGDEDA